MVAKRKNKTHIGLADEKRINQMLSEGKSVHAIAMSLGFSDYIMKGYVDRQKTLNSDADLPAKIRLLLEEEGLFGKFNARTQEFIVMLYREGIPSGIIADLLGLGFNKSSISNETAGFYEKKELTFKDKCRQAKAEPDIRTIITARTTEKAGEAIKFLEKSESTREMYKAPKEERGEIQIVFPGFSRDGGASDVEITTQEIAAEKEAKKATIN